MDKRHQRFWQNAFMKDDARPLTDEEWELVSLFDASSWEGARVAQDMMTAVLGQESPKYRGGGGCEAPTGRDRRASDRTTTPTRNTQPTKEIWK